MSQFRALFIWSQLTAVRRQNCASLGHWKVSAHPTSISNCRFFHSLTAYQYLQPGEERCCFPAIISPSTIRSQGQASALTETITSPPRDRREGLENKGKNCVSSVEGDRMNTRKYQLLRSEEGQPHSGASQEASFLGTVSTGRVFKSSLSNNTFPRALRQGTAESAASAHDGGLASVASWICSSGWQSQIKR